MSGSTPTSSGASTVLTTKGDIVGYDTQRKRIGIGSNDQVLTADSTNANGLTWKTAGGGVEYSELTSATTFTPTQQTGLAKITIDNSDLTIGNVDLKVDGSTVENIQVSGFYNKILKPTTSLEIVSNDVSWYVAGLSYESFYNTTAIYTPTAICFKTDGTKMYVLNSYSSSDRVYEFALSTAWDVTTASSTTSFYVGSQETSPQGLAFSSDGTKFYVVGNASDTIYQYGMTTAWDVSTASYSSISKNVSGQETRPNALDFSSDGTKLYMTGRDMDKVHQYNLSTAWALNTASLSSSFLISAQETQPHGVAVSADGTKLFASGENNVYQYTMSTPFDLSTASYDSISGSLRAGNTNNSYFGIAFSPDGTKLYAVSNSLDGVNQWSAVADLAGNSKISVG